MEVISNKGKHNCIKRPLKKLFPLEVTATEAAVHPLAPQCNKDPEGRQLAIVGSVFCGT